MRRHIKTESEWEQEQALEVRKNIIGELYIELPFMVIALGQLEPVHKEEISLLGTDGANIFINSSRIIQSRENNPKYLNRAYLHTVMHCIFSHLWIGGQRDRLLWGIACDIAVEYVIDGMELPGIRRAISWIRQQTYSELGELSGISAATIYDWLRLQPNGRIDAILKEYVADDHRFWPQDQRGSASLIPKEQEQWSKIAKQTQMEQKRRGNDKNKGQKAFEAQIRAGRNRRSYKDFLRKFSVIREELGVDPDEYDLGYYSYGLRTFGRMPLIEPVESKEVNKIYEFVIVIDTSYSTSGDMVKGFLDETFTLLTETDSFFKKTRGRVIQCDDRVRMDKVVHSVAEVNALMENFKLEGGGGTDFRPAFKYVEELKAAGELANLTGLIYFTDGKGIYPKKRPDYKVAFVFTQDYERQRVPAWAFCHELTNS